MNMIKNNALFENKCPPYKVVNHNYYYGPLPETNVKKNYPIKDEESNKQSNKYNGFNNRINNPYDFNSRSLIHDFHSNTNSTNNTSSENSKESEETQNTFTYKFLDNIDTRVEFNKPSNYNYFYYKLFDFNGEDLSQITYKNVRKVKLFKEDEKEKKKYDVLDEINVESSCDNLAISFSNEDCFGPQKNKIPNKDRNFKPY
jgi:hypothetical protein